MRRLYAIAWSVCAVLVAGVPARAQESGASGRIASQLEQVQRAAARGDRPEFRRSLANLDQTLLAVLPEKSSASDAIKVYTDLDRVWSYQFDSPSGAFFDASSGLLDILKHYPGYPAFIEGQTVSIRGTTYYPTKETRDFLVREAARRIASGVTRSPEKSAERRTPAPASPSTTADERRAAAHTEAVPPKAVKERQASASPAHESKSSHAAAAPSHPAETKTEPVKIAEAKPATAVSPQPNHPAARGEKNPVPAPPAKSEAKTPPPAAPMKVAAATPAAHPVAPPKVDAAPARPAAAKPAETAATSTVKPPEPARATQPAPASPVPQTPSQPPVSTATTTTAVAETGSAPASATAPPVTVPESASMATATSPPVTATAASAPVEHPASRSLTLPVLLIVVGGILLIAVTRGAR